MKLYLITRRDLLPGARGAQLAHAGIQYQYEYPDIATPWYRDSNNLVLLEVADEPALAALAERARRDGMNHSVVREPDFDNAVTAVAFAASRSPLAASLPLALKPASLRLAPPSPSAAAP